MIKLKHKSILIILSIFICIFNPTIAYTIEFKNPFITPALFKSNLENFLVFELRETFLNAIENYNKSRNETNLSSNLQKWYKVSGNEMNSLPEIIFTNGMFNIKIDENIILTFNIEYMLSGKLLINGKTTYFSDREMLRDGQYSDSEIDLQNTIKKNHKILIPLLALSLKLEENGPICFFDCQSTKVPEFQKKLERKIIKYRSQCEDGLYDRSKNLANFFYTNSDAIISANNSHEFKMGQQFLSTSNSRQNNYHIKKTAPLRKMANVAELDREHRIESNVENSKDLECKKLISNLFNFFPSEISLSKSTYTLIDQNNNEICDSLKGLNLCVKELFNTVPAIFDKHDK